MGLEETKNGSFRKKIEDSAAISDDVLAALDNPSMLYQGKSIVSSNGCGGTSCNSCGGGCYGCKSSISKYK